MNTVRAFALPFVLAVSTLALIILALLQAAATPHQVEVVLSHSEPGSYAWEQKAAPGADASQVASVEPALPRK